MAIPKTPATATTTTTTTTTYGTATSDVEQDAAAASPSAADPHKALGPRQMTMLALGGAIGTGIFLYTGSSVAAAGPGNTLLGFAFVGLFVYCVVIMLGEMAAFVPSSGAFADYASRFVGESMGFALGIGYVLQWLFSIPAEISAASIVLQFWAPQIIFLTLFIIVGIIYFSSGIPGHPGPGLSNWHDGQAFIAGFPGFLSSFVSAFYSFGGAELVALAAGEAKAPHTTVPRAVKATFFRIAGLFLLTVFVIGTSINHGDASLRLGGGDATASPMTTVFARAGFARGVHAVNATILTAILSATNGCFYATTRMLLALARAGQAPAALGRCNARGVPVAALCVTLAGSCAVFLTTIWGAGATFAWFSNLTAMSALLVWSSVGVISVRFRLALRAQGYDARKDLPFRQPLYPLLPVLCVALGAAMFAAEGYVAATADGARWRNLLATYVGLALFAACYAGWEAARRPGLVRLADADLVTGAVWGPGEGAAIMACVRAAEREDAWGRRLGVWAADRWGKARSRRAD